MHILIFSLLILFQPASWAFGTPMFTHQQMDDQSTHSMILSTAAVKGHCQIHISQTAQADLQTNSSDQQGNYMLAGCLAASSFAANFTEVVAFSYQPQCFGVIYYTPEVSFHSHTESPEIRPPLNMHFPS